MRKKYVKVSIFIIIIVILLSLLYAFIVNRKVVQSEYTFEPSESVLEGTLVEKMFYGAPGYGENPETDAKEYEYILQLNEPIKVIPGEGDTENTTKENIEEIQVVAVNDRDMEKLKNSLDKHIKIKGTLFSAVTGHHHTEVLINVTEVLTN